MAQIWGKTTTLTADGTSTVVTWGGGRGVVSVYAPTGTFGSGTAALKARHPSAIAAAYFAVKDSSGTAITFTADGAAILELPGGYELVIVVTGSTNPNIQMDCKPVNTRVDAS